MKNELRRRAEEKIAQSPLEKMELSLPEETQRVLHELRVHQIELEMQNEELRASQSELDAAKTRYFDLYDLAPVGYCTISEEGLILEANLTALTLLGTTRGLLVNRPFSNFILKEDQDIYYLYRKQLFQSDEPQSFDLRMLKKDGTMFWARMEAAAAMDTSGATMCHVAISDIAGRKRMEAEKAKLEEQNRQLQKAESLGRMAGAIAHNFNNQLQTVMGNLEMSIGDLAVGQNPTGSLNEAMQAARKVVEVSKMMLAYLGQTSGKRTSLDLAELCRTILPILQPTIPPDIILKTNLPSTCLAIDANTTEAQQVLTNLLINAREAIGDNAGTISLSLKTLSLADIPASPRFPLEWRSREQHYACLEVADSGCGIPEKNIEKIFDPFFSTKLTGRGLGLSVVLGIVKAHDAVITVEAGTNGGSVFRVFFPMSDRPDRPDKLVPGGTVLLVEDEEAVRKVTALMTSSLGFTVIQACDGVGAVEIFRQHKDKISCMICDLTMPRMNGWDTIAAIRAIRHDLPIILASGYDESSARAGVHSELPDFFLNKPYELDKLREVIGYAMARRK